MGLEPRQPRAQGVSDGSETAVSRGRCARRRRAGRRRSLHRASRHRRAAWRAGVGVRESLPALFGAARFRAGQCVVLSVAGVDVRASQCVVPVR
ncbi:hypothetical protein F01_410092 [Burkholderia cenocepacia]|nr:hypothetical protein F01_410092 [Burkholderia cenocepacia]